MTNKNEENLSLIINYEDKNGYEVLENGLKTLSVVREDMDCLSTTAQKIVFELGNLDLNFKIEVSRANQAEAIGPYIVIGFEVQEKSLSMKNLDDKLKKSLRALTAIKSEITKGYGIIQNSDLDTDKKINIATKISEIETIFLEIIGTDKKLAHILKKIDMLGLNISMSAKQLSLIKKTVITSTNNTEKFKSFLGQFEEVILLIMALVKNINDRLEQTGFLISDLLSVLKEIQKEEEMPKNKELIKINTSKIK